MPDCKSSGIEKHLCHFPLPGGNFFLINSSLSMWPYVGSSFLQCLSAISLPWKDPKPYLLALPAGNANSLSSRPVMSGHVAFPLATVWLEYLQSQDLEPMPQARKTSRGKHFLQLFTGLTTRFPFLSYQLEHSHHVFLASRKWWCGPKNIGDHE